MTVRNATVIIIYLGQKCREKSVPLLHVNSIERIGHCRKKKIKINTNNIKQQVFKTDFFLPF